MRRELLDRVDRAAGEAVDHAVAAHHRRRLARHGWGRAIEPPAGGWADGDPPPRAGNKLELLIDGAEALPRIAAELERAESHVHLTGWFFSPDFELTRDGEPVVLRNLLAALARRLDVRVLAWAGAPLPLFHPSRAEVRAVRDELVDGSRVRCALDSNERPLHCHHEKTIVIDDRVAFVGGIDLTSFQGDRWDAPAHRARARVGWHDAAALLRGPAVADVAEHFRLRWREVEGEELPPVGLAPASGDVEVQVVRTVPENVYGGMPHGSFRILESYLRALKAARRLVYLENQFLWSQDVVDVLAGKLRHPPDDRFRCVLVLPANPNDGGDETRGQLGRLAEADAGAGRLLGCTIYARDGDLSDPVYVHAKIGIVDDEWLTIGSANLNNHSLFNDTELNVVTYDARLARETRLRLWSEHLELPEAEVDGDPADVVDTVWRPIATEQLARRQRRQPLSHRLVRLPHVSKRAMRLLGPIQGLVVDG